MDNKEKAIEALQALINELPSVSNLEQEQAWRTKATSRVKKFIGQDLLTDNIGRFMIASRQKHVIGHGASSGEPRYSFRDVFDPNKKEQAKKNIEAVIEHVKYHGIVGESQVIEMQPVGKNNIVIEKLRSIELEIIGRSKRMDGKGLFLGYYQRIKPIIERGFGKDTKYLIELSDLLTQTSEENSFALMSYHFDNLRGFLQRLIDELEMQKETITTTTAIAGFDFWYLLHPKVKELAKIYFDTGLYADAVVTCLKEANYIIKHHVKAKTGEEYDGAALMTKTFSVNNPIITLADLSTQNGKDIQQGYMKMFEGVMIGIRNPKSHENIVLDENKATHMLFIASFMFVKLEDTGVLKAVKELKVK